jgi:hypothetical protein
MTSTTTGASQRMRLAIATAVTGVVLATGVSVASLVGWVRPAQAFTNTQPSLTASASATPQVVLVPIAPVTTSAQPLATNAVTGAVSSNGPSTAAGALVSSRHTNSDRSEAARVPHGERDDD